jgi:hypothetical protein
MLAFKSVILTNVIISIINILVLLWPETRQIIKITFSLNSFFETKNDSAIFSEKIKNCLIVSTVNKK